MTTITIIGAGVIGLTTGIRLCEHGHDVRIVTTDQPTTTTSAAATAMVGLAYTEPMDRVPGWEAATLAELDSIRSDSECGVRIQRCLLGSRTNAATPPGIEAWPGYSTAEPHELPIGFAHGFWIDMSVADMDRYLPYLIGRFSRSGGVIETGHIGSFDELSSEPVIVNCAGIGARTLADDDTLTPQWGMHVVVDNPGIDHCFMEGPPGLGEWVAWMPHGNRILIGGVINPDRRDPTPDHDTANRLLAAAIVANPLLAQARVIGHNSGLRPTRPAVRVEEERLDPGRQLIHNYGHGSLGVTLSWGCASDVAVMLDNAGIS